MEALMQKRVLLFSLVSLIAGLLLGSLIQRMIDDKGCDVTAVAWSSDGSRVVRLHEIDHFLDRNFRLTLTTDGQEKTIFHSPDEGKPIGTERLIWSTDGKFVLLAGKHFYTRPRAQLPTGEQAYLLYAVDTGELRCNATQATQYGGFTIDDMLSKAIWPVDAGVHRTSDE